MAQKKNQKKSINIAKITNIKNTNTKKVKTEKRTKIKNIKQEKYVYTKIKNIIIILRRK